MLCSLNTAFSWLSRFDRATQDLNPGSLGREFEALVTAPLLTFVYTFCLTYSKAAVCSMISIKVNKQLTQESKDIRHFELLQNELEFDGQKHKNKNGSLSERWLSLPSWGYHFTW